MIFLREICRIKTPLILLGLWFVVWGFKDSLMTISFLTGFIALAMILGHIVSKELFEKYKWDVGRRLQEAWDCDCKRVDVNKSVLAVGMLFARVMIYAAVLLAMAVIVLLLRGNAFASQIQERAKPLIPILKEEHKRTWPESDIAIIAAQIERESAWKEQAKRIETSGVTSYGLMQVLDSTLVQMQQRHQTLSGIEPVRMLQARWGIRAGILYDKDMWKLCSFSIDRCTGCHRDDRNRWAFTLSAYNGGFGWVERDRKLTEERGHDKNIWFNNVEIYSTRSKWCFKINREYPKKILTNSGKWAEIFVNE